MISSDEEKLLRISLETAVKPFTKGLDNLIEPTTKRLGVVIASMFTDQMRNAARVWNSAAKMLRDKGLPIKDVPLKTLKAILDGCSVEEDADLQNLWAALLANAGDASQETEIPIVFSDILRQLSPQDALFLGALLAKVYSKPTLFLDEPPETRPDIQRKVLLENNFGTTQNLSDIFREAIGMLDEKRINDALRLFDVSLGNLLRLNLLRVSRETIAIPERLRAQDKAAPAADYYFFTGLGIEFMRACEAPKSK